MTITSDDIRRQVQLSTEASEGTYDVQAITDAIVQRYGLIDNRPRRVLVAGPRTRDCLRDDEDRARPTGPRPVCDV